MKKSLFLSFLHWLKSTEMFARPSKRIPGKWHLTEFYTEIPEELVKITEKELKAKNMFWELEFTDNKKYIHRCNLEPAVFANLQNGNWQIHRNFITLNPDNEENTSVKFQFAVEKGQLRLLKKNDLGAIEFFGFFHRKNL